jgi:cell division protein YceG involved in septum cleavage
MNTKTMVLLVIAILCIAISLFFGLVAPRLVSHDQPGIPKSQSYQPQLSSESSDLKRMSEQMEREDKILKEAEGFGISYVTDFDGGEKFIQRIRKNADLEKALKSAEKKVKVLVIHEGELCLPRKGFMESVALTENDEEIIRFLNR